MLIRIATEGMIPDATLLVDVAPIVGLQRVSLRGDANHVDAEDAAFHERVRAGYLQMIRCEPQRWILVDGNALPHAVHFAILQSLEPCSHR
jgi:dTMP kinase